MECEKVTLLQRASEVAAAAAAATATANKATDARETTERQMRMTVAQLEASTSKVCAMFFCVLEEQVDVP